MPRLLTSALVGALAVVSHVALVPRSSAAEPVGTGTITVRAVGDRDPHTGDPRPLPGATIRAYTDATLTTVAGECTTDASGTCVIPDLAPGAYHVAPASDPVPGGAFWPITTVATNDPHTPVPYAQVVSVGEASPTTRAFAFWRANPPFPAACGVRVTLVFDLSQSITPEEADAMKAASTDFVDALAGTPSAIAVASFATAAPAAGNANLAPTGVAEADGVQAVKDAIAALTLPAGDDRFTNWDAALRSVVGQSDIVVLFSDGSPTVYGVPAQFPPVATGLDQIEGGVLSANAVKAAGARVLAVGVGDADEVAVANLPLVSGPVDGEDYAITTFADVDRVFGDLAAALCPRVVVSPAPGPVPAPPLVPRFTG